MSEAPQELCEENLWMVSHIGFPGVQSYCFRDWVCLWDGEHPPAAGCDRTQCSKQEQPRRDISCEKHSRSVGGRGVEVPPDHRMVVTF